MIPTISFRNVSWKNGYVTPRYEMSWGFPTSHQQTSSQRKTERADLRSIQTVWVENCSSVGILKYIRRRLQRSSGHRAYSGDRGCARARLPAAADKELAARGSITLRRWRLWKLVIGTARNQSGSAATPTHWSIVLCGRDDVKTLRADDSRQSPAWRSKPWRWEQQRNVRNVGSELHLWNDVDITSNT